MSGFRAPQLEVERKADGSYVTEFDRAAERHIRDVLTDHADNPWPILGEELGGDVEGAEFYWIIDPIDGTTAFTRGLPNFGTLVALDDAKARRAVAGVIHLPAFDETYTAARGSGARCNGVPIKVAARREWRDRLISAPSGETFKTAGFEAGYERLCRQGAHLRGNGDCWMHAMVARGSVDVLVEFGLRRWDIAASEVLIEEAGGRCTIRPSKNLKGKYDLLIGSPEALEEAAALLGF
jgi:histidinol-phosphatase